MTGLSIPLLSLAALAHLEPGSLSSPKAGQTYPAGSQVKITWIQAEYHRGNYALSYSRDGGAAWETIASWTGPSGDNVTVNYAWTVPAAPGTATQVRVCQISNCEEEEYRLISGDFAITGPAPARRPDPEAAFGMRFLPEARTLEVSFALEAAGPVSLRVHDARGALRASLLDGPHAAGAHAYSLSSASLGGEGPLFFRLEAGGQVRVLAWAPGSGASGSSRSFR